MVVKRPVCNLGLSLFAALTVCLLCAPASSLDVEFVLEIKIRKPADEDTHVRRRVVRHAEVGQQQPKADGDDGSYQK